MIHTRTFLRVAVAALLLILGSGAALLLREKGEYRETRGDALLPPLAAPARPSAPETPDTGASPAAREVLTQQGHTASDTQAVPAVANGVALFGSLTGSLSDVNGKPLAGQTLTFVKGQDLLRDASIRVQTDEYGLYYVERVPVGEWLAFFHADKHGESSVATRSGMVEILAGRLAILDVAIEGERSLRGSFTLKEDPDPESTLRLELCTKWGQAQVVASGWTGDAAERDQVNEEDDVEGQSVNETPVRGSFEFSGVPADQYVLRIYLGESSTRGRLFIEREIDLSAASQVLPPEELSLTSAELRSERK